MQGRLRDQQLSVDIETVCAHCARPMHLTADSELRFRVHDPTAHPLVFSPQVDWATFEEPNITHAF
ncbi:MAG: hypothetical protein LJF30_21015 [Acidobacteria bacterium]|nr:hypothetical protein [Acidobacteriota bacterium]